MNRAEMKAEAVKRMRLIGIFPQTVKQFEKEDLVSESVAPCGACYWLNDEQMKRVQQFEEKNNALVYHVIHGRTNFGELENYLYVSHYPEEWGADRDLLKHGETIAYVDNLTYPDCSEFGTIGIQTTVAAGLRRRF